MDWTLRIANDGDIPRIVALIPLSVRSLQAAYYSTAQMESAIGPVFAVDRQLISDGTYFVVEHAGELIGCGGWSRRRSMFGGDHGRTIPDGLIDPACDPARVRAFFVHPNWARRGIGRRILEECESAIRAAGFKRIELTATLAGEPLYTVCGYRVIERSVIMLPNAPDLPAVQMGKTL